MIGTTSLTVDGTVYRASVMGDDEDWEVPTKFYIIYACGRWGIICKQRFLSPSRYVYGDKGRNIELRYEVGNMIILYVDDEIFSKTPHLTKQ